MIVKKRNLPGVSLATITVAFGIALLGATTPTPSHAQDSQWVNTVKPPTLVNPTRITISRSTRLTPIADYDRVGCEGFVYRFTLPFDQDAIVTMGSDLQAIEYPVWFEGGRNVHLKGLEMRPKIQAGCNVGQAHQIRNTIPNIHPRLPGNKAFQLRQAGTTYLEGIDIDLRGMEADCFVSRNPDSLTPSQIKEQRKYHIVNSRCIGIEGLNQSSIGNGIHGDFFQNQGEDDVGSLVLENVTYRSSSNGITMHRWHSRNAKLFSMINVDYAWDLRYSADSRFEHSGLAFTAHGDSVVFDNVWINDGRGLDYGKILDQRVGGYSQSGFIQRVDGLNRGSPPTGEFASASVTGREYRGSAGQSVSEVAPTSLPAPPPPAAPAPAAPSSSPSSNSGFVFSRSDKSEYRWIARNSSGQWGSTWISSDCAAQMGGAQERGDWLDLIARAPGFDTLANPCTSGSAVTPTSGQTSSSGFAFSRTDTNEFRWIQTNSNGVLGSVWIDRACAERLGGVRQSGDWFELIALAPGFDTISYPCG